jgi:putative membrane protein insertion efficiency factor
MRRAVARAAWLVGWPVRSLLLGSIWLYRSTVGPMFSGRCRFHPSCSAYAAEAIRVHGAAKGLVLSAWRLLRCSPLTAGGLDPVPRPGSWRGAPPGVVV